MKKGRPGGLPSRYFNWRGSGLQDRAARCFPRFQRSVGGSDLGQREILVDADRNIAGLDFFEQMRGHRLTGGVIGNMRENRRTRQFQ